MIRINGIDEESEKRINRQYFMKDKKDYFDLSPRIVPSGKVSILTIQSKDKLIKLEGEYLVMIIPYYEFEFIPFEDYHDRLQKVIATNGKLEIPYLFSSEQLYRVIIGEQCDGETGQQLKSAEESVIRGKALYDQAEEMIHTALMKRLADKLPDDVTVVFKDIKSLGSTQDQIWEIYEYFMRKGIYLAFESGSAMDSKTVLSLSGTLSQELTKYIKAQIKAYCQETERKQNLPARLADKSRQEKKDCCKIHPLRAGSIDSSYRNSRTSYWKIRHCAKHRLPLA